VNYGINNGVSYIEVSCGKIRAVYWRTSNVYERVFDAAGGLWSDASLLAADVTKPPQTGIDGVVVRRVPVADKHFLEIYQQQGKLMYREFYGEQVSSFKPFHTHNSVARYGSTSFLATKYGLHAAFVLRGLFGCKLVYRRMDDDGFSEVAVLDAPLLHNTLLSVADDVLQLAFMSGDTLYTAHLAGYDDNGLQFTPPVVYTDYKGSGTIVSKVDFISDSRDESFVANELLVTEPWEIIVHKNLILGMATPKHAVNSLPPPVPVDNHIKRDYISIFDDTE